MSKDSDTELRFLVLEARVDALERTRPGRKGKSIIISEEDVCGVDPTRDSATCPDGTLWRRQKGCLGVACQREYQKYYEEYREGKRRA